VSSASITVLNGTADSVVPRWVRALSRKLEAALLLDDEPVTAPLERDFSAPEPTITSAWATVTNAPHTKANNHRCCDEELF
jgi:hypothetical protein